MTGLLLDGKDGAVGATHPLVPTVHRITGITDYSNIVLPSSAKMGDLVLLDNGDVLYIIEPANPPGLVYTTNVAGPSGNDVQASGNPHHMCDASDGKPFHISDACPPEFRPLTYQELLDGPNILVGPVVV